MAPGEAEAECALLQREGIVDAVLSEDVDTLMFGSGITIRNWSPEKTGKTPTHVNVYDAVETKNGSSGLDREGMILVALMSGGDYVPEGIPGCGPKTACEAAKAGFGRDLCKIPRNDTRALSEWRERLQYELKTNESKLFKRKHGALKIPDDFPRLDILGYYTHPAISNQAGLEKLRRSINWDQDLDLAGLREFTYDAFDWVKLEGAKHFIRSLAPSLLVRQLRLRADQLHRSPVTDLQAIQEDESFLVKGIHGKRQHPVTDNCAELRVSFTPIELVKIDLSKEDPDDELDIPPSSQLGEVDLDEESPLDLDDDGPKKRGPTKFDPEKAARIWVMESFVKVGVPLKVQDWEAERQTKLKPRRVATIQEITSTAPRARTAARRAKTVADMPQAPIERFAKVTKPGVKLSKTLAKANVNPPELTLPTSQSSRQPHTNVIDLLSSSPPRQRSTGPRHQPAREKSIPPMLDDLPSGITKRRRRAPMQRSQTLPADNSNLLDRPSTPPRPNMIETLDLVDLSPLCSPLLLSAKKTKVQKTHVAPSSRAPRGNSITSSPGKSRQTTLDTWRASATPTKPRVAHPIVNTALISASSELRVPTDDVETLDLTLTPPLQSKILHRGQLYPSNPQSAAANPTIRQPLTSITPNASNSPSSSRSMNSSSSSTTIKQNGVTEKTWTRRTSPRLTRTAFTPPGIDTLDLTLPHPKPNRSPSSELEILDLSALSSPAPPLTQATAPTAPVSPQSLQTVPTDYRRSPRNHKSTSPPAVWKAREKKKRVIILRKSVAGAWEFADADSPQKAGTGAVDIVPKGRERKRWRESEVEVLDLT